MGVFAARLSMVLGKLTNIFDALLTSIRVSKCETYLAAFLGRLVPYLERPCSRPLTPAVSKVPRMM
jgi:hypothetical protein